MQAAPVSQSHSLQRKPLFLVNTTGIVSAAIASKTPFRSEGIKNLALRFLDHSKTDERPALREQTIRVLANFLSDDAKAKRHAASDLNLPTINEDFNNRAKTLLTFFKFLDELTDPDRFRKKLESIGEKSTLQELRIQFGHLTTALGGAIPSTITPLIGLLDTKINALKTTESAMPPASVKTETVTVKTHTQKVLDQVKPSSLRTWFDTSFVKKVGEFLRNHFRSIPKLPFAERQQTTTLRIQHHIASTVIHTSTFDESTFYKAELRFLKQRFTTKEEKKSALEEQLRFINELLSLVRTEKNSPLNTMFGNDSALYNKKYDVLEKRLQSAQLILMAMHLKQDIKDTCALKKTDSRHEAAVKKVETSLHEIITVLIPGFTYKEGTVGYMESLIRLARTQLTDSTTRGILIKPLKQYVDE